MVFLAIQRSDGVMISLELMGIALVGLVVILGVLTLKIFLIVYLGMMALKGFLVTSQIVVVKKIKKIRVKI